MADNSKGLVIAAAIAGGAFLLYKVLSGKTNLLTPSKLTSARPVSATLPQTGAGPGATSGVAAAITALQNSIKQISQALQQKPGGGGGGLSAGGGSGSGPGGPNGGAGGFGNPNIRCTELNKAGFNNVSCQSAYTCSELANAGYWCATEAPACGGSNPSPVTFCTSGNWLPGGWMCCAGAWGLGTPVNLSAPSSPSCMSFCEPVFVGCSAPLWCAGQLGLSCSGPPAPSCYSSCYPGNAGMCLSCISSWCTYGGGGWSCCGSNFWV